jgi:1,4-alpha-glucan branching enzyme
MPQAGSYAEVLNSDAVQYGGSGVGNQGPVACEDVPYDNQPRSARVTLPPLGAIWLVPQRE